MGRSKSSFAALFEPLTGNPPFPWQEALYEKFVQGEFPQSCNLPTGLGKTLVIAIWLIALAYAPKKVPRRLVYVVNRRTVVDQSTREAEQLREKLITPESAELINLVGRLKDLVAIQSDKPEAAPLGISTLRGQFEDNREWSADPARPAIIVGTVDMIGSRLLFNGYGCGFKSKPLHAGFLGQDVLLVHDEAHLEPAFQELLIAIEKEQHESERTGRLPWPKMRTMELSATSRSETEAFPNDAERAANEKHPIVRKRIHAVKTIQFHGNRDQTKLADEITELALKHRGSGRAVLVFARTVENVDKIAEKLGKSKQQAARLTGTMRGLERDSWIKRPIFQRFLPKANRDDDVTPADGTVFLVCTSAGEVGVNISADHLVCDLSTFESMAQRFGRVNRFGDHDDTHIDIVHPNEFKDGYESRLEATLALLRQLRGDGSPAALGSLNANARAAAFAPPPTILPTSDILFDAWAMTTITKKIPGRPLVEPYLHGISEWQPPETHVAWRDEVKIIKDELLELFKPSDLLEDYPVKPHELLRDSSSRVYDRLKKLNADKTAPIWLVSDDDSVKVTTLDALIAAGKEAIERKTVLLPPSAGGLEDGVLTSDSRNANDVSDQLWNDADQQRRIRVWDDTPVPANMRRIRRAIDINPNADEDEREQAGERLWHWYELLKGGDSDGSKANKLPVLWETHVQDVKDNATLIVNCLSLSEDIRRGIIFAARFHDHGKRRRQFQTVLGNFKYPEVVLAKSGKKGGRMDEPYRHEFGSLLDVLDECDGARAEFDKLSDDMKDLVLHVIAVHHGFGRPHFPSKLAFDPEPRAGSDFVGVAMSVPQRFARLQRKYGRWGLAYLESLLRAADYAASATPSAFVEDMK